MWTGAISFGLVTVPVKLYSAVSRKTVRFHQLNGKTGVRIQQRRVDPSTGDEVAYEDIVKGYELAPDRYVVIEGDELDALDPKKTRTIDIEEFVELSDVDPIFYDHPYYLAPAAGGAKPYRLLLDAMRDTGRIAIARVVIRSKEQLVAIRPMGDVLAMSTMVFADEVIDPGRSTTSRRPTTSRCATARSTSPSSSSSRCRPTSSPTSSATPTATRCSPSSSARRPARRSPCSPRATRRPSRCPTSWRR